MGILLLLLPLGLLVYLHRSLPSIMEPSSRGVAGVWSDCLLRRPDCFWYACNRVPTAPTRPPSHRLQQMEAAASQGLGNWSSHGSTSPRWGREECWITGHGKEDHRITLPRWTGPANASTTHDDAVRTPDDACLTATPGVACYALPTGSATAKKTCGAGSHC